MCRHRGWGLGRPGQLATQDLRLQLKIKDDGLPIGIIERIDPQQGFHERVRIPEEGGGVGPGEPSGVDSCKGQPGH